MYINMYQAGYCRPTILEDLDTTTQGCVLLATEQSYLYSLFLEFINRKQLILDVYCDAQ